MMAFVTIHSGLPYHRTRLRPSPSTMNPLLSQGPFKVIYLLGFFTVQVFIRLPYWLIYYSWRPNRPRKAWTLRRTIHIQILRKVTQLPFKLGVVDGRDLSLEVPQKELESLNARFVWVPEPSSVYILTHSGDGGRTRG